MFTTIAFASFALATLFGCIYLMNTPVKEEKMKSERLQRLADHTKNEFPLEDEDENHTYILPDH